MEPVRKSQRLISEVAFDRVGTDAAGDDHDGGFAAAHQRARKFDHDLLQADELGLGADEEGSDALRSQKDLDAR